MNVFITGGTGFLGSAIIPNLLGAGHRVLGLARSDESARLLIAAGAEVHRGDLEDLESLRRGAGMADAVIHAAFDHDFSKFAANAEMDRRAIMAIGDVLEGSDRPFVVTSGLPLTPGRLATEEDMPPASGDSPRVSEQAATTLIARGVCASVVRMAQVHDRDKQGLVTFLIDVAREKGVSAYVGDGQNRWAAVHRLDAARIYRLALEKGSAGARYHAVAEQGVSVRKIADAVGRRLEIPVVTLPPEEAAGHFGWLAMPVTMDAPASSALTQQVLGWRTMETYGIIADLDCSNACGA